jgi:hypothetical protein
MTLKPPAMVSTVHGGGEAASVLFGSVTIKFLQLPLVQRDRVAQPLFWLLRADHSRAGLL